MTAGGPGGDGGKVGRPSGLRVHEREAPGLCAYEWPGSGPCAYRWPGSRAPSLQMAGPTAPVSKSVGNIRLRFGKFWGKLIKVRETDWKDG